jgi:hypothetical protein
MDYLNWKGYGAAGWVGVALMACAVVALAVMGRWLALLLSLAFLASSIAVLVARHDFPRVFDLLFVLAALVNGAGWVWDLYDSVFGYDEFAHAYTSFAISLWLGFLIYYSMRTEFRGRSLLFALVIATFGLAIGAVWEMIEWTFIQLKDPVVDLMMDGIGAVLAGLLASWLVHWETRPHGRRTSASLLP